MSNKRDYITPENVAHIRAATGLATKDAASIVQVPASSWNDCENGQKRMSVNKFQLFIQMVSKPKVKPNSSAGFPSLAIGYRLSAAASRAKPTVPVYGEGLIPLGLISDETIETIRPLSDERFSVTCMFFRNGREKGRPVKKQVRWAVCVEKKYSPTAYAFIEQYLQESGDRHEQSESVS